MPNKKKQKQSQSVDDKMTEALASVADTEPLTADHAADEALETAPEAALSNDELQPLKEQLEQAQATANDNWERYLSARAETDNIRKRAERDVANAHKYALEKFIPELLTVKDALELGTKAAKDGLTEQSGEQITKFIEGSEMTTTLFADVLKKAGVAMVNPEGQPFNPELHEAMAQIPNPDVPNNTVIEVFQKGYTLNGRLVRPAKVIVSKAP